MLHLLEQERISSYDERIRWSII